jgi:hypothetical protein
VVEHRSHSARLEQDPTAGRNLRKLGRDIGRRRRDLRLVDDRTGSGYDANVRLCHRDIQAGEILHGWASSSNDEADPIGLREEPSPITRC